MVNNGADNNGTGYNQIMANRGKARSGAQTTPPKLQPVPSTSLLALPTLAKPAAKKGRKANAKRTGDAIPAASPSRGHRGKLRRPIDPVDADGDATMGGTAAASGSSGRYAALGDQYDDTSSEGAGKQEDDKDSNDMEESEDAEDDDEEDEDDLDDDSDDDVEIVDETAKDSKSRPPAADGLSDSEEEDNEDIDLDEYEDPSDRVIVWSPEFRRLMQHNGRCVACGDGGHADARSSVCPLFRTKIDKAMAERKLPSTDEEKRKEFKIEMTCQELKDVLHEFRTSPDLADVREVQKRRLIKKEWLWKKEAEDPEIDALLGTGNGNEGGGATAKPPQKSPAGDKQALTDMQAGGDGRITPQSKGSRQTPASESMLGLQGMNVHRFLVGYKPSPGALPEDFLPIHRQYVVTILDKAQRGTGRKMGILPWDKKKDSQHRLMMVSGAKSAPNFAKSMPRSREEMKLYFKQVQDTRPNLSKSDRVFFFARVVTPLSLHEFMAAANEATRDADAAGQAMFFPNKLQNSESHRAIGWILGAHLDMHLDYVLQKLKEILGKDVDVGISVSNIKDPDASLFKSISSRPRNASVKALHVYLSSDDADLFRSVVQNAFSNGCSRFGKGRQNYRLITTNPVGQSQFDTVRRAIAKQRAMITERELCCHYLPELLEVDIPLGPDGKTVRQHLMEYKITTLNPKGEEQRECPYLSVERIERNGQVRPGYAVFFHHSLADQATAYAGELGPRMVGLYGESAVACFEGRFLAIASKEFRYNKESDRVISQMETEMADVMDTGAFARFSETTTKDVVNLAKGASAAPDRPSDQAAAAEAKRVQMLEAYNRQAANLMADDSSLASFTKLMAGGAATSERPIPAQLLNFDAPNEPPGDDASTSTLGSKSRQRLAQLEAQLAVLMAGKVPAEVNQDEDDQSLSSIESTRSLLQEQSETAAATSPAGGAPPGAPQPSQVEAPELVDPAGHAGGGDPPGGA